MKLDFVTTSGDILPLVGNPLFVITNIDGMTKATSDISSVVIGGNDGDLINNVQAQPRGIIIDLRVCGGVNVEDCKREILRFVKLKQKGKLVWEQNEKTLEIEGVVESIDMPRFSSEVTIQIALHCEQPFWEDADYVVREIDEAISLHYFTPEESYDYMLFFEEAGNPLGEYDVFRTRNIFNAGDVAVGMEIEILAYKKVTNPIIYDTNNNFFGIGFGTGTKKVTMQAGDIIRITTHKGHKTVTMNGTSILGRIKPGSTWLQMQAGANTFSVNSDESDTDNMTFSLIYKQRFV